jgi:hypothetical protein
MMNFDCGEQGGPVFFWVMMSIIQSSTEDAIRGLEAKIQLLKIRDTPGENVGTAIGKLRLNIKRLADVNRLPIDILIWLKNIFQTTSVPEFNKVFEAIGTNRHLGIVGPQPTTVHSLLTLAETTFNEFFSLGKWPTSSSGTSSLLQTQVKKTPICWNCGTSGHTVKQCTKPANAGAQAKAKAEFLKKKKENQTSSSSTKTKTKDKGADSGGGGGSGSDCSNSNSNSSDKTVRPILSQDYPQTRRPGHASDKRQHFNGVLHEWCHWCECFMHDHCTTSHKHGQFYTYPTNLVSSAGQQHVASQALPQSQAPVVKCSLPPLVRLSTLVPTSFPIRETPRPLQVCRGLLSPMGLYMVDCFVFCFLSTWFGGLLSACLLLPFQFSSWLLLFRSFLPSLVPTAGTNHIATTSWQPTCPCKCLQLC